MTPEMIGALKEKSLGRQIRKYTSDISTKHKISEDYWVHYGSLPQEYTKCFKSVLEGKTIEDLVNDKRSPVVIDLMSPSETLYYLFKWHPQIPDLGIAVSLLDKRQDWEKERDEKLGIKLVAGDIMKAATWKKIKETLSGKKADLIMERALAGMDYILKNEKMFAILLNQSWKLLNDNGIFLAQLPTGLHGLEEKGQMRIHEWINMIKKMGINIVHDGPTLKLTKTPNSPENLPFLTLK